MNRDELRSVAFKSPQAKRVLIKYQDTDFELLAPTVSERAQILRKPGKDNPSILDLNIWIAIFCTVTPGTTERVFEETDEEAFQNMQMGGFLDTVGEHSTTLLNIQSSPKNVKPDSEEIQSEG